MSPIFANEACKNHGERLATEQDWGCQLEEVTFTRKGHVELLWNMNLLKDLGAKRGDILVGKIWVVLAEAAGVQE